MVAADEQFMRHFPSLTSERRNNPNEIWHGLRVRSSILDPIIRNYQGEPICLESICTAWQLSLCLTTIQNAPGAVHTQEFAGIRT